MNLIEFKSLLSRYLKRSDLADLYDDWIGFTSSRINQQLRLAEQEFRTVTLPLQKFIQLPDDFIEMRHMEVNFQGGRVVEYVTAGQLDQMRARYGTGGAIRFFNIVDHQLELFPAPGADSEQVLTMFYYAKLPALVSDTDTNKVLDAYPQLYLYGCMVEAAAFREHDKDAGSYTQLWRDYSKELNTRQQAGRFSGDALTMRAG
jgi:hypothetical protein